MTVEGLLVSLFVLTPFWVCLKKQKNMDRSKTIGFKVFMNFHTSQFGWMLSYPQCCFAMFAPKTHPWCYLAIHPEKQPISSRFFISSHKKKTAVKWGTRPGKRLHSELERSTMLLMGKLTISMAMFNSFL